MTRTLIYIALWPFGVIAVIGVTLAVAAAYTIGWIKEHSK